MINDDNETNNKCRMLNNDEFDSIYIFSLSSCFLFVFFLFHSSSTTQFCFVRRSVCVDASLLLSFEFVCEVQSAQVAIVHQFRLHIIYNYNESVTFCTDPRMEMHVDRHIVVSYPTIGYLLTLGSAFSVALYSLNAIYSLAYYFSFIFHSVPFVSRLFRSCVLAFNAIQLHIATHYLNDFFPFFFFFLSLNGSTFIASAFAFCLLFFMNLSSSFSCVLLLLLFFFCVCVIYFLLIVCFHT